MIKNKKSPRCPYCGAEMFILSSEILGWSEEDDDDEPNLYWYRCLNDDCGCTSPAKRTEEEAYNEAVKRYEEPNRVLTLEEVLEIVRQNADGYNHVCWLEKVDVRCISIPGFLGGYGIHSEIYVNFDFYEVVTEYPDCVPREGYGKTWRCWMRNPTAQEMAETPWEGEAGDRHDE